MKTLIVSATYSEINPLIERMGLVNKHDEFLSSYIFDDKEFDILITGIGIASTAYRMGKLLGKNKYDFALNLGIAGSFNKNIVIK